MTLLFAVVATPAEIDAVARAGFDGTLATDAGLPAGGLAALRPSGTGRHWQIEDAGGRRVLHRFDDAAPDAAMLDRAAAEGAAGILLATRARLLDTLGIAEVGAVMARCRARGLPCCLMGSLEPPDVPRLLVNAPDVLVLDAAVRGSDGALDAHALALLRDLVPSHGADAPAPAARGRQAPDLIFLRDLVLPVAIGAYAGERGRTQRVRFSVEAEVQASGRPTRDMRDVVSYDLFADAIAALTTGRHVAFVETLAEEIAAAVLVHPRIGLVRVTVEKLDLAPGAVGVSIERRKGG